jgi:hypothetical protein
VFQVDCLGRLQQHVARRWPLVTAVVRAAIVGRLIVWRRIAATGSGKSGYRPEDKSGG